MGGGGSGRDVSRGSAYGRRRARHTCGAGRVRVEYLAWVGYPAWDGGKGFLAWGGVHVAWVGCTAWVHGHGVGRVHGVGCKG